LTVLVNWPIFYLPVNQESEQKMSAGRLSTTFAALADLTRHAILAQLALIEQYRQFREQSLDRLDFYLQTLQTKENNHGRKSK
jgi:hypothetical protein